MPIVLDKSGMIEQLNRNPETKVGKDICPSRIVKVWKSVTTIILRSLCTGRGVKLPKFFVATFRIEDSEPHFHTPPANADSHEKELKKHPYIYLSPELASKHNIRAKQHAQDSFDLPEADLNLSNVAKLCHLKKEQVELCLEEIYKVLDRSLVEDDFVELSLNEIGKVVIDSGLMKTEFSPSFLRRLGYSEDIKRCFNPHYTGSARKSSFLDYAASASSDDPDLGKQMGEEKEEMVTLQPTLSDAEEESDMEAESDESLPIEESEADKMRRSNAHRTLLERECVVRETFLVWETISKYIIRKTIEGLAVKIPGLGTFSHAILPNDSNNKTFQGVASLRKSRKFPVFKICPHLKEMNSLREESEMLECNVPRLTLNVGIIAKEAKLTQGIVEGILTETLLAFARGVITNKALQFPFPFIGKLHVDERLVYMSFYEEFCEGLEFNFRYDPSYITSVIPGQMTPLIYHRPPPRFHSVFHYTDMKRVEEEMRSSIPCVYGEDDPVIRNENEEGCTLPPKSNLHPKYTCLCCKCRNGKLKECEAVTDPDEGKSCRYSRHNERMRQACCAKSGSISFRQPDGSKFSPDPLFAPTKSGNLILDRLAEDKCLMQHALGHWLKRNFIKSMGREEVAKHYDRKYFKNQSTSLDDELDGRASDPCMPKKSETKIPTPEAKVAASSLPSPTPSTISLTSTESMLKSKKITGRDSMIMGLNQRRASEGSKDSTKSKSTNDDESTEIFRRSKLSDDPSTELVNDAKHTIQTTANEETGPPRDTDKKTTSNVEDDRTPKTPPRTDNLVPVQPILDSSVPELDDAAGFVPFADEGPNTVYLFESKWFWSQKSDLDQSSKTDKPFHIELQEEEVVKNLGIKKKKHCKPQPPPSPKASSKHSLPLTQDSRSGIKASVASHNLGPKKPYERKPVEKKIVRIFPRKQKEDKKTLPKEKDKPPVTVPKPTRARASSEEECPSERTDSVVFKSASSILCCSPPNSAPPLPLDYHWHKSLGNFGKAEPYRYVPMSARSGTSRASSCSSRVSRRLLERCDSTFCPTPAYTFGDDRGSRRDRMAGDTRDWHTPDAPKPSMTSMCYASFSPVERGQAEICYRMNVCPPVNVDDCCSCACKNNFVCDCDF